MILLEAPVGDESIFDAAADFDEQHEVLLKCHELNAARDETVGAVR